MTQMKIILSLICCAALFEIQANESDLNQAYEYLNQNDPDSALQIIYQYKDDLESRSPEGKRWLHLFIQSAEAKQNIQQLEYLYQFDPIIFTEHEPAVLLLANHYLQHGHVGKYDQLKNRMPQHAAKGIEWVLLESDRFLLEGNKNEAIRILRTNTFSDVKDTNRLIRLAFLLKNREPEKAWDYLEEAYQIDPNNPSIRLYRGQLLEMVNRNEDALEEYIAIANSDKTNLVFQDHLADFYIRIGEYQKAIDIWKHFLTADAPEEIWLKTFFWNRVVNPIDFAWDKAKLPNGKYQPLLEYFVQLKPDQFWDHQKFEQIPNHRQYLSDRQETFWLRLLDALKNRSYKQAWTLLNYNPFHEDSWNPELESALKQIFIYKKSLKTHATNSGDVAIGEFSKIVKNDKKPVFFKELDKTIPANIENIDLGLRTLLQNQAIFSVAFLATHWNEAALDLYSPGVFHEDNPDWVAYSYTQALRSNRDIEDAIGFAKQQPQSPNLELLIGELLIAEGKTEEGLEKLSQLTKMGSDIGFRASWLVSLLYIEDGEFAKAKETIKSDPRLSKDVLGKEALARIALLEGEHDKAHQIYESIQNRSLEAKSYLARKAYKNKDWKSARSLTEDLLKEYPNNQTLRENLKKIIEKDQEESS